MSVESLKQGVVIPLLDFTPEHYSNLKIALKDTPGFKADPRSGFKLLTSFSNINLHMVTRRELMRAAMLGAQSSPDITRSLKDLEARFHDRFEEAPWPAEVKTRPAYIRQSRHELARGTGALVIAACERAVDARHDALQAIAEFYGLPDRPRQTVGYEFVPGVQIAYAYRPNELEYLRHLEAAINDPERSIVPVTVEPGEQLMLQ